MTPLRWPSALGLLVLLAAAAYLRLDDLGGPSLWLDEIIHVDVAQKAAEESFTGWLTGVSSDRENGSLYYATQLLGLSLAEGELGVRLMPALAGLVTVGLLFWVGLAATGQRKVALVTAAFLAVSPLHVYYSREGRPYAAVMLLAMLILLLALEHRRPWTRFAIYGLCLATAYLGALAAPVLLSCAALAGFEWLRRRSYGHFLLASLSGLVVGLFLFPTVERLGGAAGAGGSSARWQITSPLSQDGLDRLLASLSVSGLDRASSNALSFVFLALALWGTVSLLRKSFSTGLWVAGFCLLPIAGWLTALVALDHWYNVRYTSVSLPAFLLLVGVGLIDGWDRVFRLVARWIPQNLMPQTSWVSKGTLAAVLMLLLAPLWKTARAEYLEKPEWRGVAALIGDLAAPGEPVITRGAWAEICIRHYLKELDLPIEVHSVNYDPARAQQLVQRYPRAWVLSAGYRETPEFEAWARGLDPILRKSRANLRLFYYPDFPAFVAEPGRLEKLANALERAGETVTRQELGPSEALLGTGWSYPEKAPDGMSFRWALGSQAQIALPTPAGAGPRELHLRVMPFPSPNQPVQEVGISVDGVHLARIPLEAQWQEVSIPLAEAGSGALVLTFDFAWSQSPQDLDPASQDPRRLAVAFDFVEVGPQG